MKNTLLLFVLAPNAFAGSSEPEQHVESNSDTNGADDNCPQGNMCDWYNEYDSIACTAAYNNERAILAVDSSASSQCYGYSFQNAPCGLDSDNCPIQLGNSSCWLDCCYGPEWSSMNPMHWFFPARNYVPVWL